MASRLWRFCKHPVGLGLLLIFLGLVAFYLPVYSGIAKTDQIDLDYGDFVAIGAFVSTIVIAVFSIIPNLQSMAETSRSAHYSELDSMYLEILTMAVDKPYLRQPGELDSFEIDQGRQYDTYAFIVWNFLETIHDRCDKAPDLRATWAPALEAEHSIHKAWFELESTPYDTIAVPKYRLEFCDFIWRFLWLRPDNFAAMPPARRQAWIDSSWPYRSEAQIRADPATIPFLERPVTAKPPKGSPPV